MPPLSFIVLELLATLFLALGALGFVTAPEDWPPALMPLVEVVHPAIWLIVGLVLSSLAVLVFLGWLRRRRLAASSD